jgi:hypothetical protein
LRRWVVAFFLPGISAVEVGIWDIYPTFWHRVKAGGEVLQKYSRMWGEFVF